MPGVDAAVRRARRGRLAILVAAVAWSTAGVGQRELDVSAATQVAGRAGFAAIALLLLVVATERGRTIAALRAMGRWDALYALLLAISSGTFLLALTYTTVANVLFMQAAAPFIAALLGWWLLAERISRRTWLAMGLAGVGVGLMAAGSVSRGLTAVALPLLMTASFAGGIVITRHRSEVSLMPATFVSQLVVVLVAAPLASFGAAARADWGIMAALGVCQIGLGLALLTYGARMIPPAEVALISLLEVVLGPLWVWLAYSERPTAITLVGGVIVTGAVLVQATAGAARQARRMRAASL